MDRKQETVQEWFLRRQRRWRMIRNLVIVPVIVIVMSQAVFHTLLAAGVIRLH
jgi:hypothetical protein